MAVRNQRVEGATLKVQYYRSAIGFKENQKKIVHGLGFRRLNAVREFEDTPALRGMIAKIPHLVRVLEVDRGS